MSLLPVAVTKMSASSTTSSRRAHLVALHRGLQRVDRIDLGDDHAGALAAQRLRRSPCRRRRSPHEADLAGDHHVGGALDAVDERVAAAVEVVELGLGDRVVDVDGREQQRARCLHLVEPVDAGGGLLGDALDAARRCARQSLASSARVLAQQPRTMLELLGVGGRGSGTSPLRSDSTPLWTSRVASPPSSRIRFGPPPSGQRSTCSVHHQYSSSVSPFQAKTGTPGFSGCRSGHRDGRGGVVLGREDVAGAPADVGAERGQRLDQHGGLDGHVQRAGDAGAGERLAVGVLGATHAAARRGPSLRRRRRGPATRRRRFRRPRFRRRAPRRSMSSSSCRELRAQLVGLEAGSPPICGRRRAR